MKEHPVFAAGCRMPSDRSISLADQAARAEAEIANERFVAALKRCIWNGGAG